MGIPLVLSRVASAIEPAREAMPVRSSGAATAAREFQNAWGSRRSFGGSGREQPGSWKLALRHPEVALAAQHHRDDVLIVRGVVHCQHPLVQPMQHPRRTV